MLRVLSLRSNPSVGLRPLARWIAGSPYGLVYTSRSIRYTHNGTGPQPSLEPSTPNTQNSTSSQTYPLSILPISTVIRSLVVTGVSSNPSLLRPALATLSFLSDSKSAFLDPDRNAGLKYILRKTIYTQFCAGETPEKAKESVQRLKDLGYAGAFLAYGAEAVMSEEEASAISHDASTGSSSESEQIYTWRDGALATVDIATDGGFVSLKFTGAGKQALRHLLKGHKPSPALQQVIEDICERARARGVRLLIDAEQQAIQPTIDAWTLDLQLKYNHRAEGHAVVYGTYQAYLRSTPATLARHIATIQAAGCILGVKLVRGAYLRTDPRHLMWERKEETDRTYDGIAESLIRRQYGAILQPSVLGNTSSSHHQEFPEVNLVLASHNRASVRRARLIRNKQAQAGERLIDMAYGQLMGMADDISCDLIHGGSNGMLSGDDMTSSGIGDSPRVYKSLVWGSVGECTKYLLRRGQENQDAASRTEDTRKAMAIELKRRLFQGLLA